MGLITWTKSWSTANNGEVPTGGDWGNIQADIAAVINGGITDSNISNDAAIKEAKVSFNTSTGHIHDGADSRLLEDYPVLLSTTTVSFAADADTTLYTVPTGKRCVLLFAIIVAGADAGATTTIAIGQDSAETDWLAAHTLSNLDAANDAVVVRPVPNTTPLKSKSYAAATVIQAQVASQSGGATNTVYLFGFLVDA